jgi:hypothetical protein
MARPNSRATLIDYCLRRLGAPVLEINVDDDQISDRIDDALQFYQEYHADAVQRVYLKHQLTSQDITNQFIPITDGTLFVTRVLPINSSTISSGMFSAKYQMFLNDLYNLNYMGSMTHYVQKIRMDWDNVSVGEYIVVEGYQIVNPDEYTLVYDDMFVKQYATALIKQQWGANLIKFDGMQLPGGVTINARQIYDDATQEIIQIKEQMQLNYEAPPMFFVG